jgi:putative ABC transport system substrate-binding protein
MTTSSQAASAGYVSAFKQGMAELGWTEGLNIEYRQAYANGDFANFEALARELVAWNAELIVAGPPQAVRAAHAVAPELPIVMAFVGDAIANGFAVSLARPGGNITGMSAQNEDMRGKTVELLHELVPGARRIAVLQSAPAADTDRAWTNIEQACATLGLQAQRFAAERPSEIAGAVAQIVRQKMEAVVVPTNGMYLAQRVPLQALLQTARLPAVFTFREHVLAGGLVSYGPSTSANFRASAKFVDKILLSFP